LVYRIFVEKKKELAGEAAALLNDAKGLLGVRGLKDVRLLNRYDAENIDKELFDYAVKAVFSEPQLDIATESPDLEGAVVFAVEYLPGQFDQRADSAAQCVQFISQGEKPLIRTARVYALYGELTEDDVAEIKKYVINPVEAREASLDKPETLVMQYELPETVAVLDGFRTLDRNGLTGIIKSMGLAMDLDDITFCQTYFKEEGRDPTVTEIRLIDTYWSDHCRHTTFLTTIDRVSFEDEILEKAWEDYRNTRKELNRTKPICLMDLATIAVKYLKKEGKLENLDESEEINACTVKMKVEADGKEEDWLLLFKNETHNHPTEIEPFGGAATCIGGAIRDPLSGRAYVYGAMRVTGAADPLKPMSETLKGKLPQRKIVTTAAAGYASYGNQIGLATGIVDEIYHPGYAAKRMEIGAVIAAAPAENVVRLAPKAGDVVILLGGATGRDGCGGATGSSKSHTVESLETCGAEVQKGNAPEERKLQRLFRNPEASRLIKRCNDFGAGGVSVAIGELADGLDIDLDKVPKKYEGLDGTELAISESQERMAVVVEAEELNHFLSLAEKENLRAVHVATVKEDPRMTMTWKGRVIADLSREFLNSNGAEKHIEIKASSKGYENRPTPSDFETGLKEMVSDLNICSKRGLSERFDSTIGAGTVLMPFGGRYQRTPIQSMVQKISMEKKHTDHVSFMSWGYNPLITSQSPYHGAYLAVVESVAKLIAAGASFEDVYLTFQEYFPHPGQKPERWGQPLAALLGAFEAQKNLGIGAIGGKDSMSGSFEDLDVPPTLVSFAVTTGKTREVVSPELKCAGHRLIWLKPVYDEDGLPETASFVALMKKIHGLMTEGKVFACYTPGIGGVMEAVYKMSIGNRLGFTVENSLTLQEIFSYAYGSFILEVGEVEEGILLGEITEEPVFIWQNDTVKAETLENLYENKLESVYPARPEQDGKTITFTSKPAPQHHAAYRTARPKVLIPAFPGTNCEYDSAKAVADAGADPEILVVRNLTPTAIRESVEAFTKKLQKAQVVFIPGGFSGGDEPDGSGKFITAFFRAAAIREGISDLLENRDGLMLGICNGFQALIKLGLVPFGKIVDTNANCPTLTFNTIGRHQSSIVRTRIVSNMSPWLSMTKPGEIYQVPISHGEGRFLAREADILRLAENGQIATQYVDAAGKATSDIDWNPNNSMYAIEGITSPDGRVLGKMGHSERWNHGLYQNVPGNYEIKLFESMVAHYK